MTTVFDLVRKTRSVRRFRESVEVSMETLEYLVDLARCTASAANKQPLKYVLSADRETNARIFSRLAWAAYLPEWPGPGAGERPAGYIVICLDTAISEKVDCDHGIAVQTMALGAAELSMGCCILGAIQREKLMQDLNIPETMRILLVLALGVPAEECRLEPLGAERSIKYYRDQNGVHHVPKRGLEEVILRRLG